MTNNDRWVSFTPINGRETIIRVRHIHELNGPTGASPAQVFFRNPLDTGLVAERLQTGVPITDEDYRKLRSILLEIPPLQMQAPDRTAAICGADAAYCRHDAGDNPPLDAEEVADET